MLTPCLSCTQELTRLFRILHSLVTVDVRDINDQVPMFSISEYNATVGELESHWDHSALGYAASDDDSEEHSDLSMTWTGTTELLTFEGAKECLCVVVFIWGITNYLAVVGKRGKRILNLKMS